jgi:hypothetical protein
MTDRIRARARLVARRAEDQEAGVPRGAAQPMGTRRTLACNFLDPEAEA